MTRARSFLGGVLLGAVVAIGAGWSLLSSQWWNDQFPTTVTVDVTGAKGGALWWDLTLTSSWSEIKRQKFSQLYDLLQTQFYNKDSIDPAKMQENALKWFIDALGDPYTVYLTPEENAQFGEDMQGVKNFEGIGAIVTKKEDGVLIEEVLKGHPAFQAGIKPLDVVLEIDGEPTQPLTLLEAVDKIRGPRGTEVTLTIYRENEAKIMDIVVTREAISVPSVKDEIVQIDDKQILYTEILSFGDDTRKIFEELLTMYQSVEIDGVIMDLRGNGGGYLPIAIELASFFIPKGKLITTAKYSTYPDEEYTSLGFGDLEGKPLIVLIDGMSASASEILAAALKYHANALLIGVNTFGKGSIQTLHEIADGSSLKYTIGSRYTPTGETVNEKGVLPDIELEFDSDTYLSWGIDNQLERAKEEMMKLIK